MIIWSEREEGDTLFFIPSSVFQSPSTLPHAFPDLLDLVFFVGEIGYISLIENINIFWVID